MTQAATPLRLDRNAPVAGLSLGPAEVISVHPGASEVGVKLKTGTVVSARLALAFVYQPAIGDVALVVGEGDAHYVIGMLTGSGKTTLDLPGDVDLRAQGKLRLQAGEGVEIQAPAIRLAAHKLDVIAGAVVERYRSLRQRVSELASQHLGESQTVVEGRAHTQAKSATILTQEKVTINGREVHLG